MKKYLISNLTEREARLLMCGSPLFGEINGLTYVFRLIGKYDELKKKGEETDIIRFSPETCERFLYEGKGIAFIRDRINKREHRRIVSRRMLYHLSRKWWGYPVIVSTVVAEIIETMIEYIGEEAELKNAFKLLVQRTQDQIVNMMPIQSGFLEIRSSNPEANHCRIAADIVMQLNRVQYNSLAPLL